MAIVYALEETDDDAIRGMSLNAELMDMFAEPFLSSRENEFGSGPLISEDDDVYAESIEQFVEKFGPRAFYLNGIFYKKMEDGLYVEFESVKDYHESDIKTEYGFVDEEKLGETDRKVIDTR